MKFTHETSLNRLSAHGLLSEKESRRSLPLREGRSVQPLQRRSLLRAMGGACAGLTASLAGPKNAKAHHEDGHHGNGPKQVIWGLMGALETLDADEIATWLDDDVIFQNTGLPDVVGKEAVRQFLPPFSIAFESLVNEVVSMVSRGGVVCTERIEHYVVSEDPPVGYPGAELFLKVSGWHEVRNGKVIRWSDYWDTRIFTATLGIPLPAA